jgi:hypothetical protein
MIIRYHHMLIDHIKPSCVTVDITIVRRYHLLILDSYRSHLTPSFNKAYKDNNIITIYMPAYFSYLL